MDNRERERIRLIAAHEGSIVSRTLKERLEAVVADHSAHGRLHSGATIKVSVRAMQTVADAYLDNIGAKIRAVAQSPLSFALLSEAMMDFLNECGSEMPRILKLARGGRTVAENDSIGLAGMGLFNQMRADVDSSLAILAYEFENPPPVETNAPKQALEAVLSPNKGGKPLAAHWDAMWADIAIRLWEGDLKPTKQKDISDAMFAWLSGKEIDAGQTAVTDRARTLWLRIEAKLRG